MCASSHLVGLCTCASVSSRRVVHECECLISPSVLDQYPFDTLPDTDLYAIRDVAIGQCFLNTSLS